MGAYEAKVVSCNLSTLKKSGVAVGLDAASLGADAFGPEEQYAKLTIGLTLSTAATINSSANHDVTGAGLGMFSYAGAVPQSANGAGCYECGMGMGQMGSIADVYSAYRDIKEGFGNYNGCMAGH